MLTRLQFMAVAILIRAIPACAQVRTPVTLADSSVDRIMVLARNADELGAVLRPAGRPGSRAKLDSLADRIAAVAIASTDGSEARRGFDAINALRIAGARPQPGRDGSPYDGVVIRLIRIHRQAPVTSSIVRAAALAVLPQVIGFGSSLAYLRQVAQSATDPTATDAMNALIVAGTEGVPDVTTADRQGALETLRLMWSELAPAIEGGDDNAVARASRSVPNAQTAATLWRFAKKQGWTK